MACCAPTCAIPTGIVSSCSPSVCYPVGGLGSLSSCGIGGYGGYGGYGSYGGYGGYGGYGISGGFGGAVSASSLGIAPGANVGCIGQTPSSEVLLKPAPFVVIVPGPILSSTCEPVRVGGYTACSTGSSGGRSSIRYSPCNIC